MSYADYGFYISEYNGSKFDEGGFYPMADRASAYVDYVTMRRAKTARGDALRAVKCAVCAIAEEIANGEKLSESAFSSGSTVASESIGNWSRSYANKAVSSAEMELLEARKHEKAVMYLAPYGLLKARGYRTCFRIP